MARTPRNGEFARRGHVYGVLSVGCVYRRNDSFGEAVFAELRFMTLMTYRERSERFQMRRAQQKLRAEPTGPPEEGQSAKAGSLTGRKT